jgi:hypothetical protein
MLISEGQNVEILGDCAKYGPSTKRKFLYFKIDFFSFYRNAAKLKSIFSCVLRVL